MFVLKSQLESVAEYLDEMGSIIDMAWNYVSATDYKTFELGFYDDNGRIGYLLKYVDGCEVLDTISNIQSCLSTESYVRFIFFKNLVTGTLGFKPPKVYTVIRSVPTIVKKDKKYLILHTAVKYKKEGFLSESLQRGITEKSKFKDLGARSYSYLYELCLEYNLTAIITRFDECLRVSFTQYLDEEEARVVESSEDFTLPFVVFNNNNSIEYQCFGGSLEFIKGNLYNLFIKSEIDYLWNREEE